MQWDTTGWVVPSMPMFPDDCKPGHFTSAVQRAEEIRAQGLCPELLFANDWAVVTQCTSKVVHNTLDWDMGALPRARLAV